MLRRQNGKLRGRPAKPMPEPGNWILCMSGWPAAAAPDGIEVSPTRQGRGSMESSLVT